MQSFQQHALPFAMVLLCAAAMYLVYRDMRRMEARLKAIDEQLGALQSPFEVFQAGGESGMPFPAALFPMQAAAAASADVTDVTDDADDGGDDDDDDAEGETEADDEIEAEAPASAAA